MPPAEPARDIPFTLNEVDAMIAVLVGAIGRTPPQAAAVVELLNKTKDKLVAADRLMRQEYGLPLD